MFTCNMFPATCFAMLLWRVGWLHGGLGLCGWLYGTLPWITCPPCLVFARQVARRISGLTRQDSWGDRAAKEARFAAAFSGVSGGNWAEVFAEMFALLVVKANPLLKDVSWMSPSLILVWTKGQPNDCGWIKFSVEKYSTNYRMITNDTGLKFVEGF